MARRVEFESLGATLRGRLYLPRGDGRRPPVVIMAHGYSATAEGMVADRYAETFREAGLAVLLYDHRGFGHSGGEPRQRIDRWWQALGFRDAIEHVGRLEGVDSTRLALWGDSLSGGCVVLVAALDPRVRAVVTQVPAFGDAPPPPDADGALFAAMAAVYAGDGLAAPREVEGPLRVVSADQRARPSALTPLTAYRWFMRYGRSHATAWQNQVTIAGRGEAEPYHAALGAAHLRVPSLFVIARHDEMPGSCSQVALGTYRSVPAPKELLEVDGGHFGLLYHPGEQFDLASRAERDFLVRSLFEDGR
jgi:alpha-beta hydrolase superfamily lysophospholipase